MKYFKTLSNGGIKPSVLWCYWLGNMKDVRSKKYCFKTPWNGRYCKRAWCTVIKVGQNALRLSFWAPQNQHLAFPSPRFTKFLSEFWTLPAGTLIPCLESHVCNQSCLDSLLTSITITYVYKTTNVFKFIYLVFTKHYHNWNSHLLSLLCIHEVMWLSSGATDLVTGLPNQRRLTQVDLEMAIKMVNSAIYTFYWMQYTRVEHHMWITIAYSNIVCRSRSGVSNMWPTGHNPARQAFLSGPQSLPNFVKI